MSGGHLDVCEADSFKRRQVPKGVRLGCRIGKHTKPNITDSLTSLMPTSSPVSRWVPAGAAVEQQSPAWV